jgi:hypothetical protein
MSDFGIKSSDPNPFASDGGGYVYDNVVNPFADMVSRKQVKNILRDATTLGRTIFTMTMIM